MDERGQYKTALDLAKRALEYIARFGTPPTPHAFELFYTVCAGQNASLNEAVSRATANKKTLSANETEKLYQEYLEPQTQSPQMETIGTKMGCEMTGLLALLGTAATNANTYQASLQSAEEKLKSPQADQNIPEMVRSLHSATQNMARANLEISANLETSRAQVELLEDCLKEVREESSRDPLTGLVNRRRFDILLDDALLGASSSGEPACLLVIDIDNFKIFNDSHGHIAGDSALRYVASCIKSNIKGQDTAARYGGEEFAVILPNTSIEHAMSLAERIRHLVNARHLVKKATGVDMGRISVSIGAAMNMEGDSAESFLNRADMCMYAAKNGGRNQVQDSPAPQPGESLPNVEIHAA